MRAVRAHKVVGAIVLLVLLAGGGGAGFMACHRAKKEQRFELRVPVPSTDVGFALALYQSLSVELEPGHQVTQIDNGAIFDALEDGIRHARTSVHTLLYIWEKGAASDRIVAALVERARAGVACRLLIDDFGSPAFTKDVAPALTAAGCDVRIFRPVPAPGDVLARNHRKVVVIDGREAYTGGFGVRDNWLGDGVTGDAWRDTNVRFTGPAVRRAAQAIAENWQEAGGPLFPPDAFPPPDTSGPSSAAFVASTASSEITRAERLFQLMIQAAKKRLWIANAYFVPSDAIHEMLKRKASEGVDVRILMPVKKSDSKASAGAQHVQRGSLIERGVSILEYEPSMLHLKTLVVDDDLSLVGSINLDPLSLNELEEVALVIQDRAFAANLAASFERDSAHARRILAN